MFENAIITDIKEIFTVYSPKGRFEKIRNRRSYGLSFCKNGQITYKHGKNDVVSDENHAVILPQGENFNLYGDKTGSFTVINFTCAEKLCDTIVSIPIQNTASYINDFEKIKSLSLFEGNRSEIFSIFYHILHKLSSMSSVCGIILPAIKYIEKNYGNPRLTNSILAEQCNISEVYFQRVFVKYLKTTPKQFIIDVRINKAKQLMSDGNLKIGAISEASGFSNQYHFCRMFKEKTGFTPTEYVERNRIYKI